MKKVFFSSVAVALLLLSGCSSKEPAVDSKANNQSKKAEEVKPVKTEEVSSDMQAVGEESMQSSNSNEMNMMEIQSKFSTVYFDFDKFNIRSDMQDVVANDASVARTMPANYNIKLEGNCDEWGSDEYNFALGLKRAKTVKNALVAEGVVGANISLVSYGESNPVCTEKTPECWAKNRRVDFKVLP